MGSSGLISIDLGLRGATVGLALMIAAILLRDRSKSIVARLSTALVIGAAAYAIRCAPTFPSPWPWFNWPMQGLSCGTLAVFWVWASAAFDDEFALRRWHALLWAAMVALGLVAFNGRSWPVAGPAADLTLSLAGLGLALSAAGQALSTWRADLVEQRRRLRLVVVIGIAAYIGADTLLRFSPLHSAYRGAIGNVANSLGLWSLMVLSGWNLFRADTTGLRRPVQTATDGVLASGIPQVASEPDRTRAIDPALLRRLEHLMSVERAYRREGLTIGALAITLGVSEYRLRQLINEGLGHRNFNAFLNRYRIDEAKAALADPWQREVPVLTIAMDAGFQSLGPFNRAFKAATDLTPTEFRRLAMADAASKHAIGERRAEIGKAS